MLIGWGSSGGAQAGRPAPPPVELGSTVQFAPAGDLAGPWQAYSVELTSRTTRDLDLRIRIDDESYLGVAVRNERLPAGARKRLFLYSPGTTFTHSTAPRYRITEASGRELAAGLLPVAPRSFVPNVYQIALFCRIPATEEDFGIPTSINGLEARFARLSPDTFPDRWIGLMALDLIVIQDAPLDELTPDQSRALTDYVRRGGTVVLSPGPSPGWLSHPTLAAFAPVRPGKQESVTSLPGLAASFGDFKHPDPFLVMTLLNGEPLVPAVGRELVRFSFGFGRAIVAGADLRRAPFDTWGGRRPMWTEILAGSPRWFAEDRAAFPSAATGRLRLELFQQMARLINPYPSFGLIFALAATFLLAVGPLNYLVMWRMKRTLLLVVTVPAISIGYLGFILGLGYVLKGTSTVVHSARLLSTRSGLDCARETGLVSIFSPATRTYDVACNPGTFVQPPGRWGQSDDRYNSRQDALATITCESGAGLKLLGMGAGQWQSWDLETRAVRDLGKGVRFEAGGGVVTIRNDSPLGIERGVYIQTGREPAVAGFGEIPPGGDAVATAAPIAQDPVRVLGFQPESLGESILRPWAAGLFRSPRADEVQDKGRKFLICVLRAEPEPVRIDARLSERSRSVTLLHVAEAP